MFSITGLPANKQFAAMVSQNLLGWFTIHCCFKHYFQQCCYRAGAHWAL